MRPFIITLRFISAGGEVSNKGRIASSPEDFRDTLGVTKMTEPIDGSKQVRQNATTGWPRDRLFTLPQKVTIWGPPRNSGEAKTQLRWTSCRAKCRRRGMVSLERRKRRLFSWYVGRWQKLQMLCFKISKLQAPVMATETKEPALTAKTVMKMAEACANLEPGNTKTMSQSECRQL